MSDACRDWLSTLWPASFKGVPFYFESDKEKGGRDDVIHVFPNRDDPFVEDLGEAPRFYSGSAYVHGDSADALAATLTAALASRGPGMLVVPYVGPVTVHCVEFERSTQRDQMGYVAYDIKWVRAGAASAMVSVPLLQNLAFAAVDSLAVSVGALFPRMLMTVGQPDYVVAAAADTIAGAAAAVDVLRQSYPTDPAVSAQLRDTVATLVASVPAAINDVAQPGAAAGDVATTLIGLVRQFADALPPATARRAMLELAAAFENPQAASAVAMASPSALPPATVATAADATAVPIAVSAYLTPANASPLMKAAASNVAAASRVARLAALSAYAEAVMRTTFAARPDGVTARGEVAERFENELYDTTGAANAPLALAIENLRGTVIEWLTRTINNLAPVVTVETVRIRPALDLAWVLYADPTRDDELVARNAVRNPLFMPRVFSALSR